MTEWEPITSAIDRGRGWLWVVISGGLRILWPAPVISSFEMNSDGLRIYECDAGRGRQPCLRGSGSVRCCAESRDQVILTCVVQG